MGDGGSPVIWSCYNTAQKLALCRSVSFILNKTNIINHTTGGEYRNSYVVRFSAFHIQVLCFYFWHYCETEHAKFLLSVQVPVI
jgi:hypothetical protein